MAVNDPRPCTLALHNGGRTIPLRGNAGTAFRHVAPDESPCAPRISRWLHLLPAMAVIAALSVLSALPVVASSCGGVTFSPFAAIAGDDERAILKSHTVIDGRHAQCVLCEWTTCVAREAVLAASPGIAVEPKASHSTARGIEAPLPTPPASPPRASASTVTFDPRGEV